MQLIERVERGDIVESPPLRQRSRQLQAAAAEERQIEASPEVRASNRCMACSGIDVDLLHSRHAYARRGSCRYARDKIEALAPPAAGKMTKLKGDDVHVPPCGWKEKKETSV